MAEPRFIICKKIVLEQYNQLKRLGLQICFSTKTNADVARILEQETDCMFSIHNQDNLGLFKDKSRIWFFPQGWQAEKVAELISCGVFNFVVDNLNDLAVLIEYLKVQQNHNAGHIEKQKWKKNEKVNLLLRMRLKEHTIFTGRYFVFGMPSGVINEWIPKLREMDNIGKLGVHFHRKSQNVSEWRLTHELQQSLSEETVKAIDIVDIGGGFPAEYKNTSAAVVGPIINEVKALLDWLRPLHKIVIAEPGRFISAPAGRLEVEIINIYENNIVVNCSVYSASLDTLVIPIKLMVEGELSSGTAYTIKGISPDSMDIFRYKVFLNKPKVGDKIVFLNAGAYNYFCDFCGYKKPKTVIVE